jgi:hypothetical protein
MATRATEKYNGIDCGQENRADGNTSMDSEKAIEAGEPDHTPQGGTKLLDVPPDGGYGWVCTACVFLINAHTWGVNSVGPAPNTIPQSVKEN